MMYAANIGGNGVQSLIILLGWFAFDRDVRRHLIGCSAPILPRGSSMLSTIQSRSARLMNVSGELPL